MKKLLLAGIISCISLSAFAGECDGIKNKKVRDECRRVQTATAVQNLRDKFNDEYQKWHFKKYGYYDKGK